MTSTTQHPSIEVNKPSYQSIGANRQTAASDWHPDGDVVAFGADVNVAVWTPNTAELIILNGHKELVKAVRFLPRRNEDETQFLLSGGDDKSVKLWNAGPNYSCVQTVEAHTGAINCIATVGKGRDSGAARGTVFATGSADATVKIWILRDGQISVLQTIKINPKYLPLALALSPLGEDGRTYVLACAGTRNIIQLFVGTIEGDNAEFTLSATLAGHDGWIHSLDFAPETADNPTSDLLLASASQDRYIRLWRIHQGRELPAQAATASDPTAGAYLPGRSPSNKAHRFQAQGTDYSVTFEALLLNHDDWVYSAKWHNNGTLRLLSASADNSLAIWECDSDSGIWGTAARLGEISREKGATTATGSIGGFWTCLWSPDGTTILTIGRTGSWRRWDWDESQSSWVQNIAISGHTKAVTGIAWSRSGDFLLSTSADQTTRLHAKWKKQGTWHEMARPQIHGYDLNCIDVLNETQFVSGADEKLKRVFNEPKTVARMLHAVAGIGSDDQVEDMPDAANMPVLGLSNKATVDVDDDVEPEAVNPEADRSAIDPATIVRKSALEIDHPPFEESLSRHTLWPETEKLYGHGYEISCLATSHDGKLIASACKASSLNHAVIRIFETEKWTELKPPLAVHTLTATRLRFSADDKYLLSVGRDRQWAVFRRNEDVQKEGDMPYELFQAEPKGHTRMILDAAWAPLRPDFPAQRVFATAGRDKLVKVWATTEAGVPSTAESQDTQTEGASFKLVHTSKPSAASVTAVDFVPRLYRDKYLVLAAGNETGLIDLHFFSVDDAPGSSFLHFSSSESMSSLVLPKPIRQLAWRPCKDEEGKDKFELAIAGDDSSLRIYETALKVVEEQ
ncbi:hypothetical protein VPNG_08488 [Cytospora leucostoma]|uniref:Elongator complex protein 2 n=1 Tax=Cytospora leucostoma TaxID=1230097 RepID=A0A423WRV1_9PEZI|nr:hypothetical protein VPNG_08488 [Cytospora leucostoma]